MLFSAVAAPVYILYSQQQRTRVQSLLSLTSICYLLSLFKWTS